MHALAILPCLLLAGLAPWTAQAVESAAPATADPAMHSVDRPWQYSLGLRWQTDDVGTPASHALVRPMLGLRYGRWRLGSSTGEDWLRHASFLKLSNVEYQWLDTERIGVGLSARIQNLEDHAGFDGFAGGRNTVRARAHITYRLTPRWAVDGEITQDLLLRGDGTTMTAGLSYLWPVSDHSSLGLSAGMTWATGAHLKTRYRELSPPQGGWHAGVASLGAGLSWRYSFTPHWAWFATVGTNRTLGQLHQISPSTALWSGQLGLLYFSR